LEVSQSSDVENLVVGAALLASDDGLHPSAPLLQVSLEADLCMSPVTCLRIKATRIEYAVIAAQHRS